jgi:two-component sensor histidine kinase
MFNCDHRASQPTATSIELVETASRQPKAGALTIHMSQKITGFWRSFRSEEIFERRETDLAVANRLRRAEKLLREKEVLLQETQHRIGNSLHMIAGILLLKSKWGPSEETRFHLIDAHRRIMSVAAVQKHLYGTRQGDLVEMAPYLSTLCESLADSLVSDDRSVELHTVVGSGAVLPATAGSIGLLVAELVINSLKHAFPAERNEGHVVIAFEANGPDWKLVVSDNGIGAPIATSAPVRHGVGSTLLRSLAEQLDAKAEIVISTVGRSVAVTHANPLATARILHEVRAREN